MNRPKTLPQMTLMTQIQGNGSPPMHYNRLLSLPCLIPPLPNR